MTSQFTQKCFNAASGVTSGLRTPCQNQRFGTGVLNELFQNTLPTYIQQMRRDWSSIRSTRVSGLVPTSEGGPFDDCVRNGAWVPEVQAAHGGPIPFLACSTGSRGAVDSWPYLQNQCASRWAQVGGHSHAGGNYEKAFQQPTLAQQRWASFQAADCHDMNWSVGRRHVPETSASNSTYRPKNFLQQQAEKGIRFRPWRPHKGRAGQKRKRCSKPKPDERQGVLVAFFANVTYLSEKTKHKVISRADDFLLLAETHCTAEQNNTLSSC